jgi:ubiquinone/menaquinone biosynthesis C-methylase UbiE
MESDTPIDQTPIEEILQDFEGNGDCVEIEVLREYAPTQPLHVAKKTGLVFVKDRRSSEEIAREWSEKIFAEKIGVGSYTSRVPIMRSRHFFVADTADSVFELSGKRICDIGAGEGEFLKMCSTYFSAIPFGVEPSDANCAGMTESGIENFSGTAEQFAADYDGELFDAIFLTWALCNCGSAVDAITAAKEFLKPDGRIVVAESSRILVPFKKPLFNVYSDAVVADLHPWFFSANTLCTLLRAVGLSIEYINRHYDQNDLVVIFKKDEKDENDEPFVFDDYTRVIDFFERWHLETGYYNEYKD